MPEKWQRVSPTAGDPMDMENLLVKLSNMRATSFVDGDGEDRSRQAGADRGREVRRRQEGRTGIVREGGRRRLRVSTGQPGSAKIAPTDFDEIMKALDVVSK